MEVDGVDEEKDRSQDGGPTLCTSVRSRNALGSFTKATLCENKQVKYRRPRSRTRLRASMRNRTALGRVIKAILRLNSQKKNRSPRSRPILCASLRSRNALAHARRAIFVREFSGRMP